MQLSYEFHLSQATLGPRSGSEQLFGRRRTGEGELAVSPASFSGWRLSSPFVYGPWRSSEAVQNAGLPTEKIHQSKHLLGAHQLQAFMPKPCCSVSQSACASAALQKNYRANYRATISATELLARMICCSATLPEASAQARRQHLTRLV